MLERCSRIELLRKFCCLLIDQQNARPIVMPQQPASGFWFGGGNMIRDDDGHLLVVGRFRNVGDSRTGIDAGDRGLELAIFRSTDPASIVASGSPAVPQFEKVASWTKSDLNCEDQQVLSIEGSCLRKTSDGYELFVSTEKSNVPYPQHLTSFLKPGAGLWTIDVLSAESIKQLRSSIVKPFLASDDPEHLHVKDPFFWQDEASTHLGFCSHPFNWSSSNTGFAQRNDHGNSVDDLQHSVVRRGTTWDVAMTRGTCVLPLPQVGPFRNETSSILFYCGGECVRELDQHSTAVSRPRGFSCEEIGGAMWLPGNHVQKAERISVNLPLFVSPHGTGCSRYVDICETAEGYFATWQQSQPDQSQPLVLNFVSRQAAEELLNSETEIRSD